MTTGNDGVRPQPGDDVSNQPGQQQDQPAAGTVFTDPDEIEMQAAVTAAQAEETAGGQQQTDPNAGQQQQPQPGAQPQGQAPAPGAAPGQQPEGNQPSAPMIPKPRLDDEIAKRTEAERVAAYWRGVAEGRVQQPAPQGGQQQQQQPQPPTPEQRIAVIDQQIDALAKQFDDGAISMAEYKRQERELSNQQFAIREEAIVAKARPASTPQHAPAGDELYLETLTAQLETDHPWVAVYDKVGTDSDWDYLKARAIENLTARGIDPRAGNVGKYELRKEIAVQADLLGPVLMADRATAKSIPLPQSRPPAAAAPAHQPGQPQPQLSPNAQARAAKLQMAADMPPDLSQRGQTGDDPNVISDSRLMTMSDDEIGALPQAVQNRLLGMT